jgi:hypothetical protein
MHRQIVLCDSQCRQSLFETNRDGEEHPVPRRSHLHVDVSALPQLFLPLFFTILLLLVVLVLGWINLILAVVSPVLLLLML